MEKEDSLAIKNQLVESLTEEIKEAFGDVKFPTHRGLHAAIAMDDWVDDPLELKKITDEKDFKGKWWEIPAKEFAKNDFSLATCYFDEYGTEFYLPAFLIFVINDKTGLFYNRLVYWLLPSEEDELYDYFCNQFSKINASEKQVCIKVLKYIKQHLLDPRDIFLKQDIEHIINHEFWLHEK